MADLRFHFADVTNLIKDDDRARITGHIGAWMMKIARRVPGKFSAVEVSWSTSAGRPGLAPTDILVYVTTDIEQSIIDVYGGGISEARTNPLVLGLTHVDESNKRALSEIYVGRAWGSGVSAPKAIAGMAFHEAAHDKALQSNSMHDGKNGLLVKSPRYGIDPTIENEIFFADHVTAEVSQIVVPQANLNRKWRAIGAP